ncbi:MAG: hypothetical protein IPM32_02345 [Ignavibacteriae bacterium]|nr:hypothetical protein [Ignavibacteriota bacterium]
MFDNIQNLVKERLSFLVIEHNFSKPNFYNIAYENYIEYKKENYSINVGIGVNSFVGMDIKTYEKSDSKKSSSYFAIRELISNDEYKKNLVQIEEMELPQECLPEKNLIHNFDFQIQKLQQFDRELRLNIKILLENVELLNGDLTKFSTTYKLKKKIIEKIKSIF